MFQLSVRLTQHPVSAWVTQNYPTLEKITPQKMTQQAVEMNGNTNRLVSTGIIDFLVLTSLIKQTVTPSWCYTPLFFSLLII